MYPTVRQSPRWKKQRLIRAPYPLYLLQNPAGGGHSQLRTPLHAHCFSRTPAPWNMEQTPRPDSSQGTTSLPRSSGALPRDPARPPSSLIPHRPPLPRRNHTPERPRDRISFSSRRPWTNLVAFSLPSLFICCLLSAFASICAFLVGRGKWGTCQRNGGYAIGWAPGRITRASVRARCRS